MALSCFEVQWIRWVCFYASVWSSEALNFVGHWKKLTIWTASSSLNSSTEKWINLNNFSARNVCSHYLKCSEIWLPSQLFQLLFQLKKSNPKYFVHMFTNLLNLCDLCDIFTSFTCPHVPSNFQEVVIDVPNDFQGVVMEVPPRRFPATDFRMDLKTWPWHFGPTIHGTNLVYLRMKTIEINH